MTIQCVHKGSLLGLKIIAYNLPLMTFYLIFEMALQKVCSYETCQYHKF